MTVTSKVGYTMEDIFSGIQTLLTKNYDLPTEKITMASNLRDDLELDSLDLTEAILAMEDEFGFEFDEDRVDDLKTIEQICAYIAENK